MITPAILGTDFLQRAWDFSTMSVTVTQTQGKAHVHVPVPKLNSKTFSAVWESGVALKRSGVQLLELTWQRWTARWWLKTMQSYMMEKRWTYEFPTDVKMFFVATIRKFKDLFITKPGTTTVTSHHITKWTVKDAYPLPLVDNVQDRLAGLAIFSKLYLQSRYWQLPKEPQDRGKTAFSPMGAYEFIRMPFGLCGAPSTFQRLMDTIMRELPFFHNIHWWCFHSF